MRQLNADELYAKFEIFRDPRGWLPIEFDRLVPGDRMRRVGDGPKDVWQVLSRPRPVAGQPGNAIVDVERWFP